MKKLTLGGTNASKSLMFFSNLGSKINYRKIREESGYLEKK